ncbi:hypothetical protein Bca4012_103066 [Brassica carinata]
MNPRVRHRSDEDGKDMDRRVVRQRVDEEHGKNKVGSPSYLLIGDEDVAPQVQESVDWTSLAYDPMLHVFTLLDHRDRASLASTYKVWRSLGASPYLWRSLDLHAYRFDLSMAASLANRCADLQKVRFRGLDSAAALVNLRAKNLKEISGESCENVTDATLSMIIARHEALESLQLGPGFGERITSEVIKVIAICCPKLKKLRLSGMRDVSSEAITSLAQHCPQLSDVGFLDCLNVNEEALGRVVSLRYLSVARTSNMNWRVAAESWGKLPNLTCLDVSRTSIDHAAVTRLLTSSPSLKLVCAFKCTMLEHDTDLDPDRFEGKLMFNNNFNRMASLLEDTSVEEETTRWLEWNLSRTFLFFAEWNLLGFNSLWNSHGGKLFLRLMQSSQEDVQEREPRDSRLSSTVSRQFQAARAKRVANLSLDVKGAKAVAEGGGVDVLLGLAKSRNKLVAQEAAGALWNLSLEIHIRPLHKLDKLLFRWPLDCGQLLESAAGALANLAGEDKCSMEIAKEGGVHALVRLVRDCDYKGAQAQVLPCFIIFIPI